MVDTAGNKLRRARLGRHLTLEDAARATKIRAHQIADLEADDYSNFANLAYARSYLANYSKFLRVDLRTYLEGFSDSGASFGLEDYQYLSDKPVGVYRIPYRRSGRARRPQRRQLVTAALGLAALVMGICVWVLYVNVQRLGDLNKLAARQEAREKAGHADPAAAILNAEPGTVTATAVRSPEALPEASPAAPIPVGAPSEMAPLTPGGTIPVVAPTSDTPAPTAAPAEVPAGPVSIPALASTAEPAAVAPTLPLSGDGRVVREMLTAHANQPQPQKVSNEHPRGR